MTMNQPRRENTNGAGFIFGLLCGAAVGAAAGILFAPKAGADLRRTLGKSTADLTKKAYDTYDQATETLNDIVSKGSDAMDRGRQAYENSRLS
jgi:gas vesicle protein